MLSKSIFDPQCITYAQMNLIFNARFFWRRLTTWTISYLISRYEGIGIEEELFGRLYLESIDFGDMLQIVFGRGLSEDFTNLINQYSFGLRDLLTAQLAEDAEAVQRNVNFLYQNIADSAAFLASINPYFDEAGWRNLMETYLRYTIEQANSFMIGELNIELTDRLTGLTDRMGDYFAQSLLTYLTSGFQYVPFPGDELQCLTYDEVREIYGTRMYWFEQITWVRAYMLGKFLGIGSQEEIYARLKQVPVDYTNHLRQILGDSPAVEEELQVQFNYIDLIDALFTAQKGGNTEEIDRAIRFLYQNAGERAATGPPLTPFWSEEEWRKRLYQLLRGTVDESSSLLAGDYSRNMDIFSSLLDLAENASSYFAQGLVQHILSNRQKQADG